MRAHFTAIAGLFLATSAFGWMSVFAMSQPAHQDSIGIEGDFSFDAGCVQHLASVAGYAWADSGPATDDGNGSLLQVGFTSYDVCNNVFLVGASGRLSVQDVQLSENLSTGVLRATGIVLESVSGNELPVVVDLEFTGTGRHFHDALQIPGPGECTTGVEGVIAPCNRTLHGRDGVLIGTLSLGSTDYESLGSNFAFGRRTRSTCIMPDGIPGSACQLFEFPF